MLQEETYRLRAEALLREAAGAENMRERSRLIDEAMHWHNLALEIHGGALFEANDNADELGDEEATA